MKSKKQKRTVPEKDTIDTDFSDESDFSTLLNQDYFNKQFDVEHLQKNSNIYPKKSKKKQKLQNVAKEISPIETPKIISQDIDLETENSLLENFEGSELQKAFLYSEIFKSANN
jgi:hypothetical protein